MFQVGDKIFYPMHGAGIVEGIEEKEILGEKRYYYILNMVLREMQVMIPMDKTSNLLIREVVDSVKLDRVLATVHQKELDPTIDPYKQRQRLNMDKMKSGDIYEGAEVFRDLTHLSKSKKLGIEEKIMLDNARQMLISELMLVRGLAKEQATKFFN